MKDTCTCHPISPARPAYIICTTFSKVTGELAFAAADIETHFAAEKFDRVWNFVVVFSSHYKLASGKFDTKGISAGWFANAAVKLALRSWFRFCGISRLKLAARLMELPDNSISSLRVPSEMHTLAISPTRDWQNSRPFRSSSCFVALM